MDMDTDLLYVANGNQTYSKNTRAVTNMGQTGWAKEIVVGNIAAFQIGAINVAQNKVVRFYLNDLDPAQTWTIDFYDQNHVLIGTASETVGANPIDTVMTNLRGDISTALSGATPSWANNSSQVDLGGGFGYIEVDIFQNYQGSNWYFVATGMTTEVRQEAWSNDLLGRFHAIASKDYLGNLFIFSTPVTHMPTAVNINSIANAAGAIQVNTATPHGLSSGDLVYLSDTGCVTAEGNPVDGYWLVTVTTTTQFTLDAQNAGTTSSGRGTATAWAGGIGEIGVATYDENTEVWTYVKLMRATQLNFRTKRQHSIPQILYSNNRYDIYYTDDYNPPGAFYYYGAYYADGAIQALNPQTNTGDRGIYAYDTVGDETRLQQNINAALVTYVSQDVSGGALAAGNYLYGCRLITETGAASPYSTLSQPVPVYAANQQGPAHLVIGSVVGEGTSKTNNLLVTGIDVDLFKFVELVSIFYATDLTPQGYTISRTPITGTTMELSHSGNEPGSETLDINELLAVMPVILTAKNNLILDRRLLLSNITMPQQYDLLDWTTTFEHELLKIAIDDIGDMGAFRYGEYQRPENVNTRVGHMPLEMYRYVLKPYYKNGLVGEGVFIDDIDFTTSATNVVTSANSPYGNRRVGGLVDFDLTDGVASPNRGVYVYYVQFSNINLDYLLPDGKRIRDVIEYFEIGRVKCIPEVLAVGQVYPSELSGSVYVPQNMWYTGAAAPATPGTYTTPVSPDPASPPRSLGFMVSPDLLHGANDITMQAGDQIYLFGQQNVNLVTGTAPASAFLDMDGTLTPPTAGTELRPIEDAEAITEFLQTGSITNTTLGTVLYSTFDSLLNAQVWDVSMAIALDGAYFELSAATDPAIYLVAYYRQDTDKYGAVTVGEWIPTGHRYTITATSPSLLGGQDIFGGDTFIQKSWLHSFYNGSAFPATGSGGIGYYTPNRLNIQMHHNTGGGGNVFPQSPLSNGLPDFITWIETTYPTRDDFLYSSTYTPSNEIDNTVIYDSALVRNYDFPTRIHYSGVRPEGSPADGLRVFQAFNFHDEESVYGEMVDMKRVSGRLVTWQPDAVILQYFNSSGSLQTNDVQEVIVGSGGVFARPGMVITKMGSRHKHGIGEGITGNGYDFVMWINVEHGKLMKYDGSGARVVSDIEGFRSFLANNTMWARDWDTPADGQGICTVWDTRFSDMIFTVRAHRVTDEWAVTTGYEEGALVHLASQPAGTYSNFEKTGEIYVCIAGHVSTADDEPDTGVDWEDFWVKASHDDNEYFNEYTFAYNEVKNKVTEFYSFKPRIYFTCDDAVLSPLPCEITGSGDPIGENRIYEHNKGRYAGWYESIDFSSVALTYTQGSTTVTAASGLLAQFPYPDVNTYILVADGNEYIIASVTSDTELELETAALTSTVDSQYTVLQAEHGENEMVMNIQPNIPKWPRAIQLATEITPYRVQLYTAAQESFLLQSDFRQRESYWYSTIKKDSTGTGINSNNTSRLFGRYLRLRLFFQRLVYQKLFNSVVHLIESNRHP